MSSIPPPASVVVFDIGNVLIRWEPRLLYAKIFKDDPERMEWFLAEVCHNDWNLAQDMGRGWSEANAEAIARHPDLAAEIRAYRERWHETVGGPIDDTVAILETLDRNGVELHAITNFASDTFRETRDRYGFLDRFRTIVVSGDERMVKPDPRIYRLSAERGGYELGRSVFIDDSVKNVAGAAAVGMRALHFSAPARLAEDLLALGLPAA